MEETDAERRQRARESTNVGDKLSIYDGAHDLTLIRQMREPGKQEAALRDALAGIRLYDLDDVASALSSVMDALNDLEDDVTNADVLYTAKTAIDRLDALVHLDTFFTAIRTPD